MPYPNLLLHERKNRAQQNNASLAGVEALNRREAAQHNGANQISYPILRQLMDGEIEPIKGTDIRDSTAGLFLAGAVPFSPAPPAHHPKHGGTCWLRGRGAPFFHGGGRPRAVRRVPRTAGLTWLGSVWRSQKEGGTA